MANGIELATAYISLAVSGADLAPQARKEFGAVEREADKVGKSSGKKFSSGIGGAVKGLGPLFAGVLAGIGVKDFLGDALGEARESQKVGALTANVIKQTGGAAKITAAQVGDLAEAISKKAGVDDEAVQQGSNLLLTFKNVRNEAGKGSDVFNRATQAAVDLSAAGFGSVDGAAKMLGKALNDPLKGISALGRAGVTFTEGQKKQIEAMVKAGDVLGAQKIIMKEVESQVGGAAAASATAGDKVKVAFGNLQESIGTALLPVLDRLGQWFLDKGLPALMRFGGWLSDKLWPALKEGWQIILPGVQRALSILSGSVDSGSLSWEAIGKVITEKVIPFLAKMFQYYLPLLATQIKVTIETVRKMWEAFKTWQGVVLSVVDVVVRTFLTMVGAIVEGAAKAFGWVPGIGPKLKTAAAEFKKFKDNVNDALDGLKDKKVSVGVQMVAGSRAVMSSNSTGGGITREASGGILPGWSPGRDIHDFYSPTAGRLMLSGGEAIMRPEFTRAVGKGWVDNVNAAARTGGSGAVARIMQNQQFAKGGVYPGVRMPSKRDIQMGVDGAAVDYVKANAKLLQSLLVPSGAGSGSQSIMGWQNMRDWFKRTFPGQEITSGFREGSISSTGVVSDHALGRAIDMPASMATFNKIDSTFKNIRQLLYSPAGPRQIRGYKRSDTIGSPLRADHWNHVHWAMARGGVMPAIKPTLYDQGGWLMPGTTLVQNNTGRPEYVTPPDDASGGSVFHIYDVEGALAMTLRAAARRELDSTARSARLQGVSS